MKIILITVVSAAALMACSALTHNESGIATTATASSVGSFSSNGPTKMAGTTQTTGRANFNSGGGVYAGSYSSVEKKLAVTIDGVTYQGHYASLTDDGAQISAQAPSGSWGRAFLFASSAKTLACRLDAGFPNVKGQCVDADGRQFGLERGS